MDSDQGTMDAKDRLNDPRILNKIKVLLAMEYVHNPFLVGIKPKMKPFHDQLLKSPLCGSCNTGRMTRTWTLECDQCNAWVTAIKQCKSPELRSCIWKNTNMQEWNTDYWQIAKIFIPNATRQNTEPATTECSKLLQLYKNCTLFEASEHQIRHLRKVIKIRNDVSHHIAVRLDDVVTEEYFDAMMRLLSATYLPPEEAADARRKLEELECPGSFSRHEAVTALKKTIQIFLYAEDNCEDKEESMRGLKAIWEQSGGIQSSDKTVIDLLKRFEELNLDKTDGYPKSPQDPGQASGAGAGESTGAIPKRQSKGAAGPQDPDQASGAGAGESTPKGAIRKRRSGGAAEDPAAGPRPPRKYGPFMTRLKEKCGKVNDEQVDRYQHVAPKSRKKEKEVLNNQFTYVREIQMYWPFRIPETFERRVEAENALARQILVQFYSDEIQNQDKCREQLQKKFPDKKLDYKGSKTKTDDWVVMVTLPITEIGRGEKDKEAEEIAAKEILKKLDRFL